MKTYRHLYPAICSFENLYAAYRAARRGKRKVSEVATFEFNQEEALCHLRRDLLDESWQPGAYASFYVHDPKRRLISAAPFRDRIVHHALVRQIEPIWERRFIFDTYANRQGKGTHRAIDRCQVFSRRWKYVLQCDVRQFFPAIDHEILRSQLCRAIRDSSAMRLIDKILLSGATVHGDDDAMPWFAGDDLLSVLRAHGLPIGNLTSQFFANVYLNDFDQYVKRVLKCPGYLRYVDDFLLFADDKRQLQTWRTHIIEYLAGLRLVLHERRAQVFPVTGGIPFLGFRIYPSRRRLKRRNGLKFQRRLRALFQRHSNRELTFAELNRIVQSWVAHARHGDTRGLRRAILCKACVPL